MNAEKEQQLLELLIEFWDTYTVIYNSVETFTLREIVGQLYINNFKSLL